MVTNSAIDAATSPEHSIMARVEVDGRRRGTVRLYPAQQELWVPLKAVLEKARWRVTYDRVRNVALDDPQTEGKGVPTRRYFRLVTALSPYPDPNSDPAMGIKDHAAIVFDLDTAEVIVTNRVNPSPFGESFELPRRPLVVRGRTYVPLSILRKALSPRYEPLGGTWDISAVDIEFDAGRKVLRVQTHRTAPSTRPSEHTSNPGRPVERIRASGMDVHPEAGPFAAAAEHGCLL